MGNQKIQMVRAVAIIAVVMIHTTPEGLCQIFCKPFINFAVAAFIFLSGYLTRVDLIQDWSTFYIRRVSRVMIPYLIWSLIYSVQNPHDFSFLYLVKNLVSANANSTLYFIFVYIQFVLLTPLLMRLARSDYRNIGWIISPISVVAFKYYILFAGVELNKYVALLWSDMCLGWFTFYYLGLILGNRVIEKQYDLRNLFVVYLVCIVLQITEGYLWSKIDSVGCGSQLKLTSLLTSTIFMLIVYTFIEGHEYRLSSRVITFIGDYSFGVYLSHIMILRVFEKMSFYAFVPYPFNSILVLSFSLLLCWCLSKVLGKRGSRLLGVR